MKVIEGKFEKKEKKNVVQFLKDCIEMIDKEEDIFTEALLSIQTKEGRTITMSNTDFESSIVLASIAQRVTLDIYMGDG